MPGVITLKDILDGVRDHLAAYAVPVTLDADITAGATTFKLADAPVNEFVAQRGLLEIADEVMWVISYDRATRDIIVVRGFQGSTAAAHTVSDKTQIHPSWGWTDRVLRYKHIQDAIRWLKPAAWVIGVSETFDWPVNNLDIQVPTSSLISYPDGNYILQMEYEDNSGRFRPFYGWQLIGPFLRFKEPGNVASRVHAIIQVFQPQLQDLTTVLNDDDFAECIELYAASLALNTLKTNRVRFAEYSASLNDRASTPDELIRMSFDLKNQAVLAKEAATKPTPPTYIKTYRDPD
jgi:hypothetical protein